MKVVAHVPGREILSNPEIIRKFSELGLGVELQLTADVLEAFTLKDFGKLRKLAGDVPVTVHAPFLDLNPGALEPYVLEATRNRFFETVVASKVLEAELIVFHTGYHPQKVDPFYDRWFSTALNTFREVVKEWSGRIALENVFDRTPRNLKKFMEHLPQCVGVCLDVGHMHLFSDVLVDKWFRELGSRVYEFHLHDNCGRKDSHLPMGEGSINFDVIFSHMGALNQDYILNFENKSYDDVLKSLNFLRRRSQWRERLSSTLPTF